MTKVKLIFLLLSLLLALPMSSCSKDGDEGVAESLLDSITEEEQELPEILPDIPDDEDSDEEDDTAPSDPTDIFTRDAFLKKFAVNDPIYLRPLSERIEALAGNKDFFFDIITGKCFNLDGEVENGDSSYLECNIPESVEVRNEDFINYNYLGADARGASIADVEVPLIDLVFGEVKFDKDSILNTENNPFFNLFKTHKRIYFKQKRAQEKYAKYISKYKSRKKIIKLLSKIFKSDKFKERMDSLLDKYNQRIDLLRINRKIARKKSQRHLRELMWITNVQEIKNMKERFSSRNNDSFYFDGETAFSYKPSNEVIKTDRFAISLWFKTLLDQGDKRLFNLHRGSSPGSALNLSLKHGHVVMGLHNGERYISNEIEYDYADGQWHNFIISKKKDTFSVYIDGVKSLEYEGRFSGFGSFTSMIGSYNGYGYFFTGDIDEISIWKKNLNKRNIKNIYNSGVPTNLRLLPSSVFLTSWWRMGDHRKDTENIQYNLVSKTGANLVE